MTKNWHAGKILLLWAVDLMILGMVLWGTYHSPQEQSTIELMLHPPLTPYEKCVIWLVLSLPLVVLTWRWLTWRERQQGGENRQEDRRLTGLNLERGFRRITWVVSVSAFVMGTFVFILHFQYRLDQWSHAGEPQPSGPPVVYVEKSDQSITSRTFPEDFTETHIKEALDKIGTSFKVAEEKFAQNSEPRLVDDLPPCFHEDRVTYVYQPASDTTPSVLYSRKALLQAEAQGELPPAVESLLQSLRWLCRFPGPVTHPFLLVLELCALLALCVAAPWGVFFLARWIAFGFKPN